MHTPASPAEGSSFHFVVPAAELAPGGRLVRVVNVYEIALFRIGDGFHAISNICPHQHAPILASGQMDGCAIICPMHGWSYDVTTGRAVNASGRLRTFEVRVEGDAVFVLVPDEEAAPAW